MRQAVALLALSTVLLGAPLARADLAGAPPAIEPDCPPGTALEGPYRFWYCAVVRCGPDDTCPSGGRCETVQLRVADGRAEACTGTGCDEVRACVVSRPAPRVEPASPPSTESRGCAVLPGASRPAWALWPTAVALVAARRRRKA